MTDKLDQLRDAVREKRDLDLQIKSLEERLSEHKRKRFDLEHTILPDMFNNAGVTIVAIPQDGNLPAYKATLNPYYKANISAEWPKERQQAAFDLLETLDLGDLIKTIFEVHFKRNEHKETKQFALALAKLVKAERITQRQGVPWSTLTAAIRNHYEGGDSLTQTQLDILGATIGMAVTLKEQRDG